MFIIIFRKSCVVFHVSKNKNNKHYRTNGPISTTYHSNWMIHTKRGVKIKNNVTHRVNGPEVISYHNDGTIFDESWCINHKMHRVG
jgi:hypothetical protein